MEVRFQLLLRVLRQTPQTAAPGSVWRPLATPGVVLTHQCRFHASALTLGPRLPNRLEDELGTLPQRRVPVSLSFCRGALVVRTRASILFTATAAVSDAGKCFLPLRSDTPGCARGIFQGVDVDGGV